MFEEGKDEEQSLLIYTTGNINTAPAIFKELLGVKEEDRKEIEIYERLTPEQVQEYMDVFKIFDDTGDGKISGREIGRVIASLGETVNK